MVLIGILQVLISIVCTIAGIVVHSFFSDTGRRYWVIYGITGLIAFTCFAQIIVLVSPIHTGIQWMMLSILLLVALLRRRQSMPVIKNLLSSLKQTSKSALLLYGSIWILIAFYAAGPTQMDDTESYHIQMVKWIKEYGTVPGLANLHERFGFNSSWFSSIALFSHLDGSLNYFVLLNSCISGWLAFYLIDYFFRSRTDSILPAWSILAIFLICMASFPVIRGNAATCNYDLISCVLILILVLESSKTHSPVSIPLNPEWIIWPAYLFTVRILNLPLSLLSLAVLIAFIQKKNLKAAVTNSGLILLIILPFLIRNYFLSGYILYPAIFPDWFSPDWKSDPEIAQLLTRFIRHYNQLPEYPVSVTERISVWGRIPQWFAQRYTWDKWILYPAIGGIFVSIILLFRKKLTINQKWLAASFGLLFILWCYIAPDPRFIYGVLLAACLVFFSVIFRYAGLRTGNFSTMFAGVVVGLFLIAFSFYRIFTSEKINLWQAQSLPQPKLQQVNWPGGHINIPAAVLNNWNPRCFASPLPCAYRVDPRLRPRGPDIADGFKIDYSISDSTRQKDLIYLEN